MDLESSFLNTDRFHDSISFRRILKKEVLINLKRQGVSPAFLKLSNVEILYSATFVFTLALVFAFSFFFSSGINSKMETGALSPNR